MKADPALSIKVEQRISGPQPIVWHVSIDGGVVRAASGPSVDATVTLTSSLDTASAIHRGELSAQRAFLDGALQIGGDLQALIDNRAVLAEVSHHLGGRT